MTSLSGEVVDMRTDRLVAILLMLQRREQVTATEVATELEVSERTARRDLDALAMSGIPVYSIQGRGGGWRLLGGARTDLSGLTASEARALFLVRRARLGGNPGREDRPPQTRPRPTGTLPGTSRGRGILTDPGSAAMGIDSHRTATSPLPRRPAGRRDP